MAGNKTGKYSRIHAQLEELLKLCSDPLARMATINAILYHKMDTFSWVGFYMLTDGQLIVGPYQGPLACQVLEKNKGICWAGVNEQKVIIVPDVHEFPGHIACDSHSRSEIVIPLRNKDGVITGVMDIDSRLKGNFDAVDAAELERICLLIYRHHNR